ncbi:asparaginyl tRNA synthetase [Legionella quinlivanii]|uniref:Asparagine--tRNA ligase n=1 Tax=Legionella quinlivanii TaxID=45073 RepID=A0A0W0XNE8_9GAMM|nr:asparagine--tRNA ligase [Legionella quinlivanii]KTD46088.1 asparaginyl tRNA synthetase [Legionella quinlivanii]MCW8451222.1 asparagine--tRNA ligase [Legionella quinlivanii]SEG28924.1 asparaginyl-tRNA synthetase [Legionella quinlivanii DSM 21216]STY10585.1 asparaginyl tRNA synthetase [Legionella quinlivanii]
MTEVYTIKQCLEGEISVDETVCVRGWVKTRRDSKAGVSFVSLHDGSCFAPIQLVASEQLPNYQSEVLKLTAGCALIAKGKLVTSQGKGQSFEIQVEHLEVVGWVENPESYPIQAKRHTLEFLRDVAHLRPRTNTISAVTRIRHCLAQAIHRFFHERGYFWVHTPIITASDCEGAGEMFRVSTLDLMNLPHSANGKIDFSKDFFGREAFLTVSGQLNVEAYCLALSKVYTFGPTFRAENSNTSRHLAEFWMVEPEIAFADLSDIARLSQEMLRYLCKVVLDERSDDMAFFNQFVAPGCIERLENIIESEFEVMSYTDAISALQKADKTFDYPVSWGLDLQSEHERYIAEELCKKPVIITDYPKEIKGFYMRLNDDGRTVAAMDVLAPGIGEIIGGSQREERLDVLDQRMEECKLSKQDYNWYRDLRRYGTVPHAGYGLGFERLISYVTGVGNVRDVIPFPRTPGNANY